MHVDIYNIYRIQQDLELEKFASWTWRLAGRWMYFVQ